MSSGPASRAASRRTAIGAGLVSGGALLTAACGGNSSRGRTTQGSQQVVPADVKALEHLLDLERAAIAAYTAGIPLLAQSAVPAAQQFLQQELSHEGELVGLIKQAGVTPPEARPSYNLGHPRTGKEVVELLHRLESEQIAAYLQAIPALQGGQVRGAAAAIAANDAQHLAILRELLGQPAAPAAFVTGRE